MKNKWVVLIITLTMIIPYQMFAGGTSAEAAAGTVVAKAGDIVSYTGQVLVRSQGKWMRLKQTPHAVYSSDKIVTKRGRAEVKFTDGSTMRLDVDSNVTITQKLETAGTAASKPAMRKLNVLLGKVVLDVKQKPDGPKYAVRTPTMTAAIRGTVVPIVVGGDGSTEYDVYGDADVMGGSKVTIGENEQLRADDIVTSSSSLPASDPVAGQLAFMRAAEKATDEAEKADRMTASAEANLNSISSKTSKKYGDALIKKCDALLQNIHAGYNGTLVGVEDARLFQNEITGKTVSYRNGKASEFYTALNRIGDFISGFIPNAYAQGAGGAGEPSDLNKALAAANAAEGKLTQAEQAYQRALADYEASPTSETAAALAQALEAYLEALKAATDANAFVASTAASDPNATADSTSASAAADAAASNAQTALNETRAMVQIFTNPNASNAEKDAALAAAQAQISSAKAQNNAAAANAEVGRLIATNAAGTDVTAAMNAADATSKNANVAGSSAAQSASLALTVGTASDPEGALNAVKTASQNAEVSSMISDGTRQGQTTAEAASQVATSNPGLAASAAGQGTAAEPDKAGEIVSGVVTAVPAAAGSAAGAAVAAGGDAGTVTTAAVTANPDAAGDVAGAAVSAGGDPATVTSAAVSSNPTAAGTVVNAVVAANPASAGSVTQAAISAGGDINTVVNSAYSAGGDPTAIAAGALASGASTGDVSTALTNAGVSADAVAGIVSDAQAGALPPTTTGDEGDDEDDDDDASPAR